MVRVGFSCRCAAFSCKCVVFGGKCMRAKYVSEAGPFAHGNGQRRAVGHDGAALPALALHLGHAVEVDDGVVIDADERIRRQGLLEMVQALGAGDGLALSNKVERAKVVLAQDVRDAGHLHLPEALGGPHDNPILVCFHAQSVTVNSP